MDNFDWVTAIASCSVASVFARLRVQVGEDVRKRQELHPQAAHYGFRFQNHNDYNFAFSLRETIFTSLYASIFKKARTKF
jgi:hypothetical protein